MQIQNLSLLVTLMLVVVGFAKAKYLGVDNAIDDVLERKQESPPSIPFKRISEEMSVDRGLVEMERRRRRRGRSLVETERRRRRRGRSLVEMET